MKMLICASVLYGILLTALSQEIENCINSCEGLADGDYQSCVGCNVYATCSNQLLYDERPCPDVLVWDDNVKRCEYSSETCPGASDTPSNCVSSCSGLEDGDYQSCLGCGVYVTCSNEILYDDRPCPADLVWDDNVKRCEYTSTTCPDSSPDKEEPVEKEKAVSVDDEKDRKELKEIKDCISSCQGMEDGDYQSCAGCNVYATCSNQLLYDERPCPDVLVWDDNVKRCEYSSETCPGESETSSDCVSSCSGMEDGDYQSCLGCDVYVTCSNEILYDERPCPAELVWDDNVKRCEYISTTCQASADTEELKESEEKNTTTIDMSENAKKSALKKLLLELKEVIREKTDCIDSCDGLDDGDYQSCSGCDVYATCSNGNLEDNRPCPENLLWDDGVKRCEWSSETCGEKRAATFECVSSCEGVGNGDYQSCQGCDVYVTCSNQVLYDNRPCPADLVWNDSLKRCEWKSSTCKTPSCYKELGCASINFKYKKCSVKDKEILSASLINQVSDSTCEFGDSFGVNDKSLWVDNGCRGDFKVCACSKIRKVSCNSNGYKYKECKVKRADTVLEVKLLKQKSKAKCEFGKSYGINGGSIWVDKGCRGWFNVCV